MTISPAINVRKRVTVQSALTLTCLITDGLSSVTYLLAEKKMQIRSGTGWSRNSLLHCRRRVCWYMWIATSE